jgi:hypothetical protein
LFLISPWNSLLIVPCFVVIYIIFKITEFTKHSNFHRSKHVLWFHLSIFSWWSSLDQFAYSLFLYSIIFLLPLCYEVLCANIVNFVMVAATTLNAVCGD